jgi:hypothetical protein
MNESRRLFVKVRNVRHRLFSRKGVSQGMGVGKRPSNGVSAAIFDSMFGAGCPMFWLPRKPRQAPMKYNLERRRN